MARESQICEAKPLQEIALEVLELWTTCFYVLGIYFSDVLTSSLGWCCTSC